jgi:sporulation protein YlmC with PRC-barrel domain
MTETLIKSGETQGMHVAGIDGDKLGAVRELFLELSSGQVAFVIVEAAGLLGGSGKFHPVPWSSVRYDAVARHFQVEMTRADFKASPSYDREQLANRDYAWDEQATRYFSSARPTGHVA